jgi:hypothetical protein
MQIAMTAKEIALFKKYIPNASSYFEYGCGGSTFLVNSYINIRKIVSIDSCSEWIEKTKKQILDYNKIKFYHIDINSNCLNWGFPIDNSKKSDWIKYPNSIREHKDNFDLILIDGRFRVSCCAAAAMKMSTDSILLLHDCHRYKDIPLTKIDQAESLAVYIKANFNEEELTSIIDKYKNEPK